MNDATFYANEGLISESPDYSPDFVPPKNEVPSIPNETLYNIVMGMEPVVEELLEIDPIDFYDYAGIQRSFNVREHANDIWIGNYPRALEKLLSQRG